MSNDDLHLDEAGFTLGELLADVLAEAARLSAEPAVDANPPSDDWGDIIVAKFREQGFEL